MITNRLTRSCAAALRTNFAANRKTFFQVKSCHRTNWPVSNSFQMSAGPQPSTTPSSEETPQQQREEIEKPQPKQEKTTQQQQQQPKQQQQQQKPQQSEELQQQIEKLTAENEQLRKKKEESTQEIATLKDKYLRVLAEVENTRKAGEKEAQKAKIFGIQNFGKDLIDVSDNLGRALSNTTKANLDSNAELKVLYEGVAMTRNELNKAFNRNGMLEFTPKEDDKFDPAMHMALFRIPTPLPEKNGLIGAVLKSGFSLHGRVIRAAQVGVFDSPPPPSPSTSEEESDETK